MARITLEILDAEDRQLVLEYDDNSFGIIYLRQREVYTISIELFSHKVRTLKMRQVAIFTVASDGDICGKLHTVRILVTEGLLEFIQEVEKRIFQNRPR